MAEEAPQTAIASPSEPGERSSEAPESTSAAKTSPAFGRRVRKFLAVTLFSLVGPGAIGLGALYFYGTGGRIVSTENAYVKADKIAVSADVSGRVVYVGVNENQKVV
ncbi:MAG: HlyD family secretion protein, partial [Rhodospirillaceae bacterium]|nr:HlyD family secretion protein [Rhodospirillaceae bacterium]